VTLGVNIKLHTFKEGFQIVGSDENNSGYTRGCRRKLVNPLLLLPIIFVSLPSLLIRKDGASGTSSPFVMRAGVSGSASLYIFSEVLFLCDLVDESKGLLKLSIYLGLK